MLLTLITSFLLSVFHPLHLSVLEIQHNPKTQALEMSQRVFVDDFEDLLRQRSGLAIDVINPKDPGRLSALISEYLQENLTLEVNGKPVSYTVIGHEREEDAIWIYLEASGVKRPKEVVIKSRLFAEKFSDQTNFINFTKADGDVESLRLTADRPMGKFRLD